MMELDRASPTAAHWTEAQYRHALLQGSEDPERLVLVAEVSRATAAAVEEGGRGFPILGFLLARHLAPEWELENIAVAPGARRKGLGTQLLKALLARARETGAQAVFLEVRESNTAARRLYEKAGFQQAGRRKSYYADPPDDAVLYRHSLI
jgi:ribosomal-protein-alanine N-acetyltransferase